MLNHSKWVKLIAACIYLCFGTFSWYLFTRIGQMIAQFWGGDSARGFSVNNPNFEMYNNLQATGVGVLVVLILFFIPRLNEYIGDVADEITRVSWASFEETRKATAIVLALVAVAGLYFFLTDTFFESIMLAIMESAGAKQ